MATRHPRLLDKSIEYPTATIFLVFLCSSITATGWYSLGTDQSVLSFSWATPHHAVLFTLTMLLPTGLFYYGIRIGYRIAERNGRDT